MALLAQRHREWGCLLVLLPKIQKYPGDSCRTPFAALLRKCERLQIAHCQKGLAWKAVAQPHLPMHCSRRGTESGAACLSCQLKLQTYLRGCLPDSSSSPAPKMRTSPDSWQPEGASLESFCSALSDRGTARTEAQRVGLLACLATSNFKRVLGGPSRVPPAALL